jgi:hypothetical protein
MTHVLISVYDTRGQVYEVSLLSAGCKVDIYNNIKKSITTSANVQLAGGYITNHSLKEIIDNIERNGYAELNAEVTIMYKDIRKMRYVMLFWRPSMDITIRTYDDEKRALKRFDEIVERENEENSESELNGCVALYEVDYKKKEIIKIKKEFTN